MANFVALSSGATYTAQQPAGWNKPCTESHLASISEKIADWRAVSPHLGLTEAEEREILESIPHSVSAQKIAMLRKWKEKQGGKGTYRRLCRVFETECKRADLVYLVKQLLAETSSSSDEEGIMPSMPSVYYPCAVCARVMRLCPSVYTRTHTL